MGAHRHLKIYEAWALNQVREKITIPIYSTCLNAEQELYDLEDALREPHAWVFGNEGAGISPEFSTFSKGVSIPQDPCIESLNVGAATAICLFEAKRVRR
jgi:TrmH family RNA methyltransferase